MIKDLYLRLCMCGVFTAVMDSPLLIALGDYCAATDPVSKNRAYGRFANVIYSSGMSLADLVAKLVFEDENVYIRSHAHDRHIDPSVEAATAHELSVFEELASLSSRDFARDMGVDYVCPFDAKRIDLPALYAERVRNIDKVGYGIFSSYPMFRLSDDRVIEPIVSADRTSVEKFVGYAEERGRVMANTLAFIEGRPAANTLLCGDAGTGKSSTVKAVANHFFDRGVRLIELRKDQLHHLPYVMGKVSENPLRFIIFIDDLAFNKSDDNFSMLKAALEGSASAKADNAVIYATSNRRHIIKERFEDREGGDVHRNDTLQETLSLSERFGLVVLFQKPSKQLYLEIVHELAARAGITMDASELDIKAEAFALRRGNRSARCAEHFIDSLL
ncbi:MAG: ATP-binding protein [Clostridia bacterium]|nr:ATP-binding protein [Clostridia bacterium]